MLELVSTRIITVFRKLKPILVEMCVKQLGIALNIDNDSSGLGFLPFSYGCHSVVLRKT